MFEKIEKMTLLWGTLDNKEIFNGIMSVVGIYRIPFCLVPIFAPSILLVYHKDHDFDSYNGEEEIQNFIEHLKKLETKKVGE